MSEIWNLSALCRCCHADGNFKSLKRPYMYQNKVEVYAAILHETFGVSIIPPPFEASYSICDDCIKRLRDAKLFKDQVVACDQKFQEYCRNEQAVNMLTYIKVEVEDSTNNISEPTTDDKSKINITYEGPDIKSDDYDYDDNFHDTNENIKEEDDTPEKKPAVKKRVPAKRKLKTEQDTPPPKVAKTDKPKPKRIRKKDTSHLVVHLNTETEKVYSCKLCGGNYKDKTNLQLHVEETHKRMKVECEHCQKIFSSKYALNRHAKLHTVIERDWKCNYCDRRFTSKCILRSHENTQHTKKQVFTCDLCKKDFYTKAVLRRHLKWHEGTLKSFVCETCGLCVNDKTNLNIHIMTVHEKIRKFTCTHCGKAYSTNKSLKMHMFQHNGLSPHKCDKCRLKFFSSTSLKKHKLTHGEEEKKIYQCKVCPMTFELRGRFKSHVRNHSGFLPYKCHLCSKDFSCKYSLNRHVYDHSGIKRYFCDQCQAGFTQKTALVRHVSRVHDPTKSSRVKVKCDLCKQNVYDLEKHKQRHFERPHICTQCKRSYPTTSALNRHIRNDHLGFRQHPCDQCAKAYTRPDALRRHKDKKHKMEPKIEQNYDMCLNVFTIENKPIDITP